MKPIISRRDYQEILLARMAGGDLYANEVRLKFRRVDMLFDVFREKPIYSEEAKKKELGKRKTAPRFTTERGPRSIK